MDVKKAKEEIEEFLKNKFNSEFGFCGLAIGDGNTLVNSSDSEGNDIIIQIKLNIEEK